MTVDQSEKTDVDAITCGLRDLMRTGRYVEVLAAARAWLDRAPSQRDALYWSVVGLRLTGQTNEAVETLKVLESAHPGYSRAAEERGNCWIALGESARARSCFQRAVALNPALAASWKMLEGLLSAAGDAAGAAAATRHLEQLGQLPDAIVEAGGWFSDGDYELARERLEAFVASQGRHVEALRLLGRIAQRRGARERAESLLSEVVERAPGYGAARLDLVRVLIERQKYATALAVVEAADAVGEMRFLRATILAGLARHDEAVAIFRELADEAPSNNQVRIVLGHSLKTLGRTQESIEAYRRATRGRAHVGDAYWSLANLKTYRFAEAEVERMRALEALPELADRAELCFALAKSLEDREDFAQSWAFYERGNSLARERRPYLPEAAEEDSRQLRDLFTADFFAARAGVGASARDPIFIVGLPRSGSTMLEQILASHPEIDGTQELYDIPRIVAEFGTQDGGRYPELLSGLDPLMFERLGLRYLDDISPYRGGRRRFLDKMPNNFWHIGLIHLMLPKAKIVDVRRHPMASCVSNYRQFYAKGQNFCYSIEGVARHYRTYLEVMRHWNEVLPGRIISVTYEDLVEDLESSVRRILRHCDLAFDAACLEFHRNKRVVNTPSSEQVRQPLFQESVSGWRRFEPWLEPLRTALGDALYRWEDQRAHLRNLP